MSRSGSRRNNVRTDAAILLLDPFVELALASCFCSSYSVTPNKLFHPTPTGLRVSASRANHRAVTEGRATWTILRVSVLNEVFGI